MNTAARAGNRHRFSPQLTAFFTSAPILFSRRGQLLEREIGRPHGSFIEIGLVAEANVAYLVLNFCALLKKQRPCRPWRRRAFRTRFSA